MRVLFVAAPLLGHVFPLVPLATAMRELGHEVVIATGGDALKVHESGLPVEPICPTVHMGRLAARIAFSHPLAARAEMSGAGDLRFVSHLFAAVNKSMLDGLSLLATRWSPDLVVHEPLAAAGSIVAASLGAPSVVHDISLFDGAALTTAVAARMRLPIADFKAVLRTSPPSVVDFGSGRPLRFVPYQDKSPAPEWRSGKPRILVSRSTVAGPGGSRMMAAVIACADQVDAEFVVVRPPQRDGLPSNVHAVDWIPMSTVLPKCAAVVHHGGAGTLLGALVAGIPQVIEPGVGDRTRHATLVAARGAGLSATASEVTPELLTRLITDHDLARAAKEVSAEIAAMPSPKRVAQRLLAE